MNRDLGLYLAHHQMSKNLYEKFVKDGKKKGLSDTSWTAPV
jgi:hypothetical protein